MPGAPADFRYVPRRLIAAIAVAAMTGVPAAWAQWAQWGGPQRDFSVASPALADDWPEEGPPKLWSREIGHGHSAIIASGERLYTMCRREDDQDAVLCVDAGSGKTVWEFRYDAPTVEGMDLEFGAGPHSTPLLADGRLFTVGAMVDFHCIDAQTGKVLWKHDLREEMQASVLGRGYGASPLAYGELVIVNVGGAETGIAAFDRKTGELAWKGPKLRASYSSPIVVKFNGEDHLICSFGGFRAGLDPQTGEVRWQATVDSQSFGIMATPVWIEPDCVFFSAGYGGGSRLFRIKHEDGAYVPEALWHYRKMQVVHGSMVHADGFVYGSSHGSFGPAFFMAMDLKTGKPAWRQRGLAKANVVHADNKLIILDERGVLALAEASRDGLEIRSRCKLLEEKSWTCPTLVGDRLYLRDYKTMMALDLGAAKG